MSRWRNKAITNLLKNSQEDNDYAIAAKEWEFTGSVFDYLTSDHICQLCEGENLRYHFEIKNKITKNSSLLVGSSCIKKFDITVINDFGIEIFGNEKSSFLQKKIEEKKKELMIEQVRALWIASNKEEKQLIEYYIHDFKIKNGFSPDNLLELFQLMHKYNADYSSILFKVSLRSKYELNSLLSMPEDERNVIVPCLTVSQKTKYIEKIKQQEEEITNCPQFISEQNYSRDWSLELETRNPKPEQLENQNSSEQLISIRSSQLQAKETEPCIPPEYITCSVCGEYKEWATLNPNVCRSCLNKTYLVQDGVRS